MATVLHRKGRVSVGLLAITIALALSLVAGSASARASTSTYCGGWLGPVGECYGASRALYQTYGWGEQAGVCVGIEYWGTAYCTTNANTGVYSWNIGMNVQARPWIRNNSSGNNLVHGVALTY